ncbi:hypothetical protein RUM44_013555 [Polyplax serrata]|uniref:Uncharacterized protein n=1 Tax=Polyplax serrata TaxID=468196 RepID=A0ABR1BI67_POLSC
MLIKSDSIIPSTREELTSVNDEDVKKDQVMVSSRLTGTSEEQEEGCGRTSKSQRHISSQISDSLYPPLLVSQKTVTSLRLGRDSAFSYLSDITEIKPHLLLCGAVALRGNILEELNVTCVINATRELPDTPLPTGTEQDTLYLRVNLEDKPDSNILQWLDMVTDIVYQVKMAGGKTLIHCVAGISRSATLCLAYLIRYEDYSLHDAYLLLKSLRHTIRPNSGFFGQLIEFEKQITGKQTVWMIQSDYTQSYIPQLYEEDFRRFRNLRQSRMESS